MRELVAFRVQIVAVLLLAQLVTGCGNSSDGAAEKVFTAMAEAHTCRVDEAFSLPRVVGEREAVARRRLQEAGLEVRLSPEPSESVRSGVVVDQFPPGYQKVCKGWPVVLFVSSGKR